ncbi:MAG TPA: type II toxin-antitoxin system RelE/ParE family toxin [Terriglobales bacterium]|nr:type II toxin-antitoxin system RelE/ParE family toxin [Terriglobales bacterium]
MRIRWTEPATRDLIQIADYLEKHGSSAIARRIALSIYERIGALAQFPEQGRTGRKSDTRELVLSGLPYLAVYRLNGDAIEILRILHGAQIWP